MKTVTTKTYSTTFDYNALLEILTKAAGFPPDSRLTFNIQDIDSHGDAAAIVMLYKEEKTEREILTNT